jgi:type VI secretion system secreted protein VgrG
MGIQEERLQDVRDVLAIGRKVNVEFEAELEEMLDGVWRVGGLPAVVGARTDISGEPYAGAGVHVRGYLPGNGQIVITELEVEKPDRHEEPADPLEPATATAIEEPTEHPEPTATLQPTEQPQPTRTPAPSSTPRPTETHEPSQTPQPTETQEPSKTPHPTETHRPSETPHPTPTPEPSPTPGATPTAEPTEHPEHQTGVPGLTPTQEH